MTAEDDPIGSEFSHGHFNEAGAGVESGRLDENVGLRLDRANSALPLTARVSAHEFLLRVLRGKFGQLGRC